MTDKTAEPSSELSIHLVSSAYPQMLRTLQCSGQNLQIGNVSPVVCTCISLLFISVTELEAWYAYINNPAGLEVFVSYVLRIGRAAICDEESASALLILSFGLKLDI